MQDGCMNGLEASQNVANNFKVSSGITGGGCNRQGAQFPHPETFHQEINFLLTNKEKETKKDLKNGKFRRNVEEGEGGEEGGK